MQYIFETIRKYQMIRAGEGVVVGVSGGADSLCLLYVLKEYSKEVEFPLFAVHVEHGIRGQESLKDADFTEEICRQMGVPCQRVSIPVQQIAREQGLSVEEAGRQERYRIFEEVRRQCGAARIAVAHNQNDQAETMLWNLIRGSGLKGLGGILPVRERIIRPLLFTDRKDIERILHQAGLTWRTDRTNLEEDYTRNKIRLSLIPQMERELNGQAGHHMAQAAHRLQQVQSYLERMTDQAAAQCLREAYDGRPSVILLLESFHAQDELIQTELLKRAISLLTDGRGLKNIGSIHLEMLLALTGMDCGKECHLPGGIRAVREDGVLRFCDREKGQKSICEPQGESGLDAGSREELGGICKTAQVTESSESICKTVQTTETPEDTCKTAQTTEIPEAVCQTSKNAPAQAVPLPIPGELRRDGFVIRTSLLENGPQILSQIAEENKYTKWLSYDTINDSVHLRRRQTGDYLVINEAGGQKKLKNYFIDCKIPKEKRDDVLLLADGSHILWVVGHRISEKVKVRPETQQVLKVQIEEEKEQ